MIILIDHNLRCVNSRMPQTSEVRKRARIVAKRLQLEPWYDYQEEVLKVVGHELGLQLKPARKRKREPTNVCVVCMESADLVVLAPCGHRQTCKSCLRHCRGKCPTCRSPWVSLVEKVFD